MNVFKLLVSGFVLGTLLLVPAPSARADDDDDWEDRWEDYREELEDRREEQRERWEEWREDREEALEDWREDRRRVRHPAWRPRIAERQYWNEELPPPRPPRDYGYYEERPAPAYRSDYYWEEPGGYAYEEPQVYEQEYPPAYEYEVRRPEYRYYGTPGVGYTEYGRERSVQVGPFRVYWTR
jgi:hypothetical protein